MATMNSTQRSYLQGLARGAFKAQGGYRGGIDPQAQLDTAVRIAGRLIARKALMSNTTSPKEAVERAVAHVRTGKLPVAPSARTVPVCGCGKPAAPHSPTLHQA